MSPTYPLMIGSFEKAALADLRARAAASPTPYKVMQALAAAHIAGLPTGMLNEALTVEIPIGYSVTLTHEEHRPGVMCRHASIGLRTRAGRGPSPEATAMLLEELGFVNKLGAMPMWLETLKDGTVCPNFVEPLDGNVRQLEKDDVERERDRG